jgi:hypothetical protein
LTKIFLKQKHNFSKISQITKDNLLIPIAELELPVRAYNSLVNEGVKTLADLVVYKEKDLKRFPNLGQTSIDDIKKLLISYDLSLDMNIIDYEDQDNMANVNKIDSKEEYIELSEEIILEIIKNFDETTLSLRSKNALRNLDCFYVGDILKVNKRELYKVNALGRKSILEIEDYIKELGLKFGDAIDPWNNQIVEGLRDKLRKKISDEKRQTLINKDQYLEIEIDRILRECIKISGKEEDIRSRVIDVLKSRFGLDGSPAKTLEIIGQKYNVTRERIRQNQEFGLRKLRTFKPITPILDKVFEILNQYLPVTEIELNKILKEKNITKFEWDFKGLQDFYESFGLKQDFYISKINNVKVISKASVENIFRLVLINTNKMISNSGLFSLNECMNLKDIYLNNIKKETVKKIIQTKPLFKWLDNDKNYFTYYSSRNRLSNLISKVSKISKRIEVDLLYQKIKNYPRIYNDVNYKSDILVSFCKFCFECELESENVIKFNNAQSKISKYDGYKGKFISSNEDKMVKIFKEYGPIIEIDDLKDLTEKNEIKRDSLNMILQFSPLFHRIDTGFYKLTEKIKYEKMEKIISIINLESISFDKDECPIVKDKKTYIEVNKDGHLLKSLPYERPLRLLPDGSFGVVYKKNVYPIISSLVEKNGERINKNLT